MIIILIVSEISMLQLMKESTIFGNYKKQMKKVVFISHITAEKEVAIAFKKLIESKFLNMVELFVSSDDSSIQRGQRWLDSITKSLEECAIEIVICSPKSVSRPWINFEAGAGWIRKIPVIPLCHSGMEPSKLPVPLNLLQAAKATEVSGLKGILPVIAEAIGSTPPDVDFTEFIETVKDFEERYLFWDECNSAFEKLSKFNVGIDSILQEKEIEIQLTESQINVFNTFMPFLEKSNILECQNMNVSTTTVRGVYYTHKLIPLSNMQKIISHPEFKYKI